jgi:DNA gyrase subunit B
MQYNDGYNETILTFANNINNHDGGTHLSGFKTALTGTINRATPSAPGWQGRPPQRRRPARRIDRVISVKIPSRSSRADQGQAAATARSKASSARP